MRLLIIIVVVVVVALAASYHFWVRRSTAAQQQRRRKQWLWAAAGLVVLGLLIRGGLLFGAAGAAILLALLRAIPSLAPFVAARDTPAKAQSMSRAEALALLDLESHATKEQILRRYRELMVKVHPDRGGSSYMATMLNRAKEVLLG